MQVQNQEDCDRLLERFYGFCDGLIRSIVVRYLDDGTRNLQMEVSTRDCKELENEGWVCVQLTVSNVQDFCIRENAKTTIQVLSEGIHVRRIADTVCIEFGGALETLQSLDSFRSADAFAIGSELDFVIGPY